MPFHPKITASALSGALTAILIAELARRGLPLTGDEGAGIAVILSFVAGYFTPAA